MDFIFEFSEYYNIGDLVIIEYWYNGMITPVKIIDKQKRKYRISHNIPESEIFNAPEEIISSTNIIDHFKK